MALLQEGKPYESCLTRLLTIKKKLDMSAKIIVMQGNMVATIEETNKDAFIKRGEYKETDLDRRKREVDFLITSIANRYEVTFNHKVELKESRSIKKSEYFDNIYYVTENALNKLKKQYSYECDL